MKKFILILIALFMIVGGVFLLIRKPKPNILLVVVDTMREDLGGARAPFFSSLKERGIYFKNTFTTIPITLPAHLSMFTGKYPFQNLVINNGQKYQDEYPLLAERLKKRGYHTYAVVSLGTLQGYQGPARGFDVYQDKFPPTRWYKTADEVNREVEEILPGVKSPFFLWIHYSDPHEPYAPPWLPPDGEVWVNGSKIGDVNFLRKEYFFIKGKPGEKVDVEVRLKGKPLRKVIYSVEIPSLNEKVVIMTKKGQRKVKMRLTIGDKGWVKIRPKVFLSIFWARFLYSREVDYWDREFKKLYGELERRGLLKNTYVFILADHGEGLGEWKGHKGHIHFLNGIYTRIPLLLLTPDGKKGVRNDYRQIVDIFPTVLRLTGSHVPKGIVGRDLMRDNGHERLFLQTYAPESFFDRFSIIENDFQLIHTPAKKKYFFFNLKQDHGSIKPIPFNKYTPVMMKRLREFEKEALSHIKKRPKRERKMFKVLRSLGYVK